MPACGFIYSKQNHKNMISEKICKKVKLERTKKGISHEELALLADVNKNTIWKIETGQVSPNIKTLEKIAKALEIEFQVLMDISKVDL